MRGVNLFGRTKKSSKGAATTTPGRVTAAVPTTPEQHQQRGGNGRSSTQQPRQAAAPPGYAPPQRPPKRVESPPALPLPLTPEPRLLRLFPEYEAYDDAVDRQYYHRQQQHQPQHQKQQQQQQPNSHPQSHSTSAAPVLPIKQEVKLPDGEKGLENNQGQYNCFINVVIQALWHLTAFRERFVRGGSGGHDHCCPGPDTCVHCALQAIFVEYQFSEQAIIPPTALRQSLAVLYKDESRFQMNQIDDAAEALEAILDRLHHTERAQKDKNADPAALEKKACPCLVHNAFGVRTMDLLRCDTCSATTEPKATSLFVAYAYTYALREARAKAGNENGQGNNGGGYSFCQFFQRAAQEDRRWCPNAARCNKMCVVEHHLLYLPKVFSVGLVWPSVEGAPVDEIAEVMDMITMQIDLSNIFITSTAIGRYLQQEKKSHATGGTSGSLHDSLLGSGVFDSIALDAVPGGDGEQSTTASAVGKRQRGKRVKCVYELRGMICYYGQHYNCYFNSPATGQWYVFDDVMVNAVGSTWAAVKERCLRGHLQPSVLFYEKKEVLEVDVAEEDEGEGEEMPADDHQLPVPTTSAASLPRDAHVVEAKAATAAATADDDDDGGGEKEAIARAAREVEEGGMEALKRTIGAEILELLLQGEEQWKKERERERELDRMRQSEERSRAAQAQAQAAAAVVMADQEHEESHDHGEEEEEEEVDGGTAMNRSWFVRTPEGDQAAETAAAAAAEEGGEGGGEEKGEEREEGDTKTEPSTPTSGHARAIAGDEAAPQRVAAAEATTARRSSSTSSGSGSGSTGHGAAAAKCVVPQLHSDEVEEDSEWEIIDNHDDDDHHDDFTSISAPGRRGSRGHTRTDGEEEVVADDGDDDDVEIIFENERERPERDDECDAERKTKSARAANESEYDEDDDVEIVDETEGGGRRERTGSAFAVLSTSGSASSDLDISFTMLDRPHDGGGGVGEVQDGSAPLEVTVTRTSWLYRRESRLYRFGAEELLRIEPDTQARKEAFRYDEMAQILLYGSFNMVIRFVEASDRQVHYIDGEGVERIAQLLCLHNSDIALTRQ